MLVKLQWLGPPLSPNVQGWTYGEMVSSPSFDAPWFGDKLLPKHEPLRNHWDRRVLCRRIDGRTNGEKGRQRPKAPSFSASRFPAFAHPLARARSPAPPKPPAPLSLLLGQFLTARAPLRNQISRHNNPCRINNQSYSGSFANNQVENLEIEY